MPEQFDKQTQRVIELASNPPSLADHGTNRHAKQATGGKKFGIEYQVARIARDFPEILERMKRGEFRSVRQAAIAAGLLRPQPKRPVISIPTDADPETLAAIISEHWMADPETIRATAEALLATLPKSSKKPRSH